MRFLYSILLLCLLTTVSYAQMQNNNWCIGNTGGISFNSTGYTSFISAIYSSENCATISHRTNGNLLFYTDGNNVYNAQHYLMPNGAGIGIDPLRTSLQGSVIIPFPTDTARYYVFTVEDWSSATSYLRYSVIDMTLDGGNGDVVPGQKAIIIDDNITEGMTVINSCSETWLATVKKNTGDFNMVRISPSGINSLRVVSPKGYNRIAGGAVALRFSPDLRKIALAAYNGKDTISFLAIHDFDRNTGVVSNGVVIDSVINSNTFYGCEFSANSRRLYTTAARFNDNKVYQFDLHQKDITAVRASRKILTTSKKELGTPQMGPDGNIYIPVVDAQSIDRISNSDELSPIYTKGAVQLVYNTSARYTLPQLVRYTYEPPLILGDTYDTVVCHTPFHIIKASPGHLQYRWQDNSTDSTLAVTASGRYTVQITDSCFVYTDTFDVVMEPVVQVDLPDDTALCDGHSMVLKNKLPSAGQPQWSTGSTAAEITISHTGKYILTMSRNNCTAQDSVTVTRRASPVVYAGDDTTICEGTGIILTCNTQPAGSTYLWSTGEAADVINATEKGQYTLTVSYMGCSTTDTVNIAHLPIPRIELGNDTAMCYGKVLTVYPDYIIAGNAYTYLWGNGSTDSSYDVKDDAMVRLRLTNSCGTGEDSMYADFKSCAIWLPGAFSPNGDGLNDLCKLLGDIDGVTGFKMVIYNRWGQNVFTTNDVRTGWDGTYKGIPAETGTYYYLLRVGYKEWEGVKVQTWKGDITLVR